MHTSGKLRAGRWLFWVLIIVSCDTAPPKSTPQKRHFDIPGYFRSEISRFVASGSSLQKIVHTEGKTESHTIREPDWNDAFQYFLQIDLNSPGTAKWLMVDTLISGTELQLNYASVDSTAKLKRASVFFTGNTVDSVAVALYNTGLYGTESQFLTYKRGVAYKMHFLLNPTVGKATDLEVAGKVISNL
ncbi:MAG TPA: hypothetical protein VFW78_04170 [Bacteroidia bacterium]|nr:hypothetical protein [Bacteroidia bacterium]